jgi:predicted Zn-dependent protease
MDLAEIIIGVGSEAPSDIGCNAAHEFGHALGLDTHSDERSDIMYPVHELQSVWGITHHDLEMLAALYKAASAAAEWSPLEGP